MRLLALRSREVSRPQLPAKGPRQSSFAVMFEYSPKKHQHMAKNPRFTDKELFKITFYSSSASNCS